MNRLLKKFSIYWGRRKLWMVPVILMGLGEQRGRAVKVII